MSPVTTYTFAGRYNPQVPLLPGSSPFDVLPGRFVAIRRVSDGGLATVYTTRTKSATAANPVQIDDIGNLGYLVDPGDYTQHLVLVGGAEGVGQPVTIDQDPQEGATDADLAAIDVRVDAVETAQAIIEAEIEVLSGKDFVVLSLGARDAITTMVDGSMCRVRNIDRIYQWDQTAAKWKSLDYDLGFINVLDYGAIWSAADNSAAFQAAINDMESAGGTRSSDTILCPPPPDAAPTNSGFGFTAPFNIRGLSGIKFVAIAGNHPSQFSVGPLVTLFNTTNTQPIVDADNDATAPGLTGLATDLCVFEGLLLYQPSATVINASHVRNFVFHNSSVITFADTPAIRAQNSFWVFAVDSHFQNAGTTTGIFRMEGKDGNPDVTSTYLCRFTTCRFVGGPWAEYHYIGPTTHQAAGNFYYLMCDGENQAGDSGMFCRTTKDGGVTFDNISNLIYEQCSTGDTISGSNPWTLFSMDAGITLNGVQLRQSACSNANTGQVRMRAGASNAFRIKNTGGAPLKIVDSVGALYAATYGFVEELNESVGKFTGDATAGAMELRVDPVVAHANALTWAIQGEAAGRMAIGHDGYIGWGDGVMANPDVWLHRTAAAQLGTNGDLAVVTAGKGLRIKEGSNAKQGPGTLVAGSLVVATTAVTATSRIYVTGNADGGTPGWLRVSSRVPGTSFTVTSSSGADTSTFVWLIVEIA